MSTINHNYSQAGAAPSTSSPTSPLSSTASFDTKDDAPLFTPLLIIGAGFSGLCLSSRLKSTLNFVSFHIYDRNPSLGGTWYSNAYPGCACDVPALLYSFSFHRNLGWTKAYPGQREIEAYMGSVVERFGLEGHMSFRTECVGAEWEEERGVWVVELVERILIEGENVQERRFYHECRVLVSATGLLVDPSDGGISNVPGYQDFLSSGGRIIHTSRWPHGLTPTSPELAGKKVVVIGNGSTAAQLIPTILPHVEGLTQIFRTPHWYIPQLDSSPWSDETKDKFAKYPILGWMVRHLLWWGGEWDWRIFYTNWWSNWQRAKKTKKTIEFMKRMIPKKYWDLLIPRYEMGCKRQVRGNAYLKALHDSKLSLVNGQIISLQPGSITTNYVVPSTIQSTRTVTIDITTTHSTTLIILATGFTTGRFITSSATITGRHGKTLSQTWIPPAEAMPPNLTSPTPVHPTSYLSLATANFPNFFFLLGPNSGQGHTSIIVTIENEVEYLLHLLKPLIIEENSRVRSIAISPTIEQEYTSEIHTALEERVWQKGGCTNWYSTKIGERQWNFMTNPWSQSWLWWKFVGETWVWRRFDSVGLGWMWGWRRGLGGPGGVWEVEYFDEAAGDGKRKVA